MASCTAEWLPSHTYCMITVSITHEWTEEKMRPLYMSCLYICAQFPQNFRDLETSVFCCYTNLLSSHDFSLIWMVPATDHALRGRWQCSTQFFACSNCPHVHSFQPNAVCNTESAIFFFPLKFIDRLKWSDAECCRQSDIVPDFKNARMCLTSSIILHCDLSADKQTRLPRELGACAKQALFPSPLCKSLGTRQRRSTLVHLF